VIFLEKRYFSNIEEGRGGMRATAQVIIKLPVRESPQNGIAIRNACWEGSYHLVRNMTILDTRQFYKSKTSSRFLTFDANNAWQMDHNSR